MKKAKVGLALLLAALMLPWMSLGVAAEAAGGSEYFQREFFVSTDGSDENPGSIDAPFASLEAARDAVRELGSLEGKKGSVRVYLREGTYRLEESFRLSAQDSGTADCRIIYSSYPGERAVLAGGQTLLGKDFTAITNSDVLERIPKTAQKNVVQVDLGKYGITEFGEDAVTGFGATIDVANLQLFYNGEICDVARWPNQGEFATAGQLIEEGAIAENGNFSAGGGKFTFEDEQPLKWQDVSDAWIFGYFKFDWAPNSVKIRELDREERTITLDHSTSYGIGSGFRYYVYNLLEELDTPGEWYLDRDTGILYLYPEGDVKAATVELPLLDEDLVSINNASFVTLKDLDFSLTRRNGVGIERGESNLVIGCNFSKILRNAVVVTTNGEDGLSGMGYWPRAWAQKPTGKNHGVVDCEISQMGEGGIILGAGDRFTLTPGNCYAENNKIHDYGLLVRTYKPGITLVSCGNWARYNEIYNAPHYALDIYGNDLFIEYNDIHNVVQEADDAGAIHPYGDWTFRGNRINDNYFHDIESVSSTTVGVAAVYLDAPVSGFEVQRNIIESVNNKGIWINGGRDNLVYDNILIDVPIPVFTYAYALNNNLDDFHEQFYYKDRLFQLDYQEEPWASRYPELVTILEEEFEPVYPVNNQVQRNVLAGCGAMQVDDDTEYFGAIQDNVEMPVKDIGFTDYEAGDLTLKKDAGVYEQIPDFNATAFSKIGLYEDDLQVKMDASVALMVGSPVSYVFGQEGRVDPENSNVIPQIVDSRTLVPVRFIAESFGAEVGWDPDMATVTVNLDGKTIQMVIGSNKISVDGVESELDVPAQSIEGRTMIPLRAMVEAVGKQVVWDPAGMIVISDQATLFSEDEAYLQAALLRKFL